MTEQHRYIPEHPVPMRLEAIANTKSERIELGKITAVRVQTIAMVESFKINQSDVEFVIVDENKQNRMVAQKILTSAFPRSRAEEFLVNDYVDIFGKVRVLENGTSFLNALSINVTSAMHFEAFKTTCRMAKKFYEENLPQLPTGVHSTCADKLGLRKKAGALDRFPIDLLEQSSSQENNNGVWPTEIEDLVAGIQGRASNGRMGKTSSDSSSDEEDEETTDSEDEDDDDDGATEEEEEEEDSFDAGPVCGGLGGFEVKKDPEEAVQEESMEDSFDAGPPKTVIPNSAEKIKEELEPPAVDSYDSFEDL